MFERFTERAIRVIMASQEEAKRLRCGFVGGEHFLLGMLRESEPIVVKTLEYFHVDPPALKESLETEVGAAAPEGALALELPFNAQAKKVIEYAWDEARGLGHNYVGVEHLFLGLLRDSSGLVNKALGDLGITWTSARSKIVSLLGEGPAAALKKTPRSGKTPLLELYGRDLTTLATEKKLDPVVGRAREIERVTQILSRRRKNNPVLIGEAGVGKTAIVEGLAQKIVAGDIPRTLQNKRLVSLDLGLLIAGTRYRGEFEERLKKVIDEVIKSESVVLFIDELHTLIGAGAAEGAMDAANILKPALARGEIQCIGATTIDEYRKRIESDPALERRFQSVMVGEPSVAETIEILKGLRARYEEFHKVKITDDALLAAGRLSARYIPDRFLPDKAIDLIDEAASRIMLKGGENKIVDAEVIAQVVSAWTSVPVTQLTAAETERLLKMEAELSAKVIGQEEAIKVIARSIRRARAGLKDPRRPIGSFIFLGPSGVGKTELAKRLAEFLFGETDAMIRLDMSEYLESHTVSRLVGSPPGYVGFGEGGQLTEPVRRRPHSVVLFDEIEKAHPDVMNILLQILDEGQVTDAQGHQIDFKNTVIIMTSNVGADLLRKESQIGFVTRDDAQAGYEKMKATVLEQLKKSFRPEFLNRVDESVVFRPLAKEDLAAIIDVMLAEVNQRLEEKGFLLVLSKKAKQFLVDKSYDPKYGARPLRRALEEKLEDPLSEEVLRGRFEFGTEIKADIKKEKMVFSGKPKKFVERPPQEAKTAPAARARRPRSKPAAGGHLAGRAR
ncbi:MAG: ATP-dependent Clp protease ATP-binding subunit [Candidatus Margulisiibacteriota bacterium]